MKDVLHPTTLPHPNNFPRNIIGVPTWERHGDMDTPGHFPLMFYSVQKVLGQDGMLDQTMTLVSDASTGDGTLRVRERWMKELDGQPTSEIFILTPESQQGVAESISRRIHVRLPVVDAILNRSTYDTQRTKMDALIQGAVFENGGTFRFYGGDDDTRIPLEMKILKPDFLSRFGIDPDPNSYVLWVGPLPSYDAFDRKPNSLKPFFEPLGATIFDLKQQYPSLRVSDSWVDQMHIVMEHMENQPAIFHVTYGPVTPQKSSDDRRTVISVINTKTRFPDPRTVIVAMQELKREFTPAEHAIVAYLAGPPQLFAIQQKAYYEGEATNVDSANMSWLFNEDTQFILRWFVSDPTIDNGLVDGQYRSENEYLTELLEVLSVRAMRDYAYLSGIETEVEHHRALDTGYRPKDPAEQAASSLIGNIVALAALERTRFHKDKSAYLDLTEPYIVPEDKAKKVFDRMNDLEKICANKIHRLRKEYETSTDQNRLVELPELIQRFKDVSYSIHRRLSNMNFQSFFDLLNKEVNEQLAFSNEVLQAYPKVIVEVGKLLVRGEYPVLRYVPPRERGTNYPQTHR